MNDKEKNIKDLHKRINIVIGQLEGIKKMIDKPEPDCIQVFNQIKAAKNGISRVGKKVIENGITKCITKKNNEQELQQLLKVITEN